jgi:hypothetical protein
MCALYRGYKRLAGLWAFGKIWALRPQRNNHRGGIVDALADHVTILVPQIFSHSSKPISDLLAGVSRHFEGTDESHQLISLECHCQPIAPSHLRSVSHQSAVLMRCELNSVDRSINIGQCFRGLRSSAQGTPTCSLMISRCSQLQ